MLNPCSVSGCDRMATTLHKGKDVCLPCSRALEEGAPVPATMGGSRDMTAVARARETILATLAEGPATSKHLNTVNGAKRTSHDEALRQLRAENRIVGTGYGSTRTFSLVKETPEERRETRSVVNPLSVAAALLQPEQPAREDLRAQVSELEMRLAQSEAALDVARKQLTTELAEQKQAIEALLPMTGKSDADVAIRGLAWLAGLAANKLREAAELIAEMRADLAARPKITQKNFDRRAKAWAMLETCAQWESDPDPNHPFLEHVGDCGLLSDLNSALCAKLEDLAYGGLDA